MADAATGFVLNSLKELLQYHADLIRNARGNIENLERDLGVFKAFLRDTAKKRKHDESTKQMVKEIHDAVYEVEDIIDVFVTKTIEKRHKNKFFKFWNNATSLHDIGKKVEGIKDRVVRLRNELNIIPVSEDKLEKHEPRPPRKKDIVGFEDVIKDLIRRLTQETDYLDVVSLIGMFGLGKTTLAWKIFNDKEIVYKFPNRIWLPISQMFTKREIFLDILKKVTSIDDNILEKKDDELADLVADHLKNGSFLIVMDDLWTVDDWKDLSVALPLNNTKCKVLITSRTEEVGTLASKPRLPNKLRFFEFKESWELFKLEVFGEQDCPSGLELVGKEITRSCDGLPLAIVVIGGILAPKFSVSNITAIQNYWQEVSTHVSSYLIKDGGESEMQKLIHLSYDRLPYHLRACFLYLGLFPEDNKIQASKLFRMWIGEGFIQQQEHGSLEEIGHMYLAELINRNLIKGVKFKADNKVKTCQIHDTLRNFCRTEAASENFLKEITYNSRAREFVPPTSNIAMYRRLSIHSNCLNFISPKPFGPSVRSFVCFPKDKYVLSAENSTKIIGAFKLVRILDVLSFKFTEIDRDLYNLVHMRYLALSSELSILPSDFTELLNIQTVIIDTTSRTLEVKANIWKMRHLRHFKTNASAILPKSTTSGYKCEKLQTLSSIAVESCNKELCLRAPNLKKLGIRGKLALLFNKETAAFDSLGEMKDLARLKLVNDAYPDAPREGGLDRLPRCDYFPPGLTSLTLFATFLDWEHMSTLGKLEKLKVLKLKDNAFVGRNWHAQDKGFQNLELLQIEQTDLAYWKASSLSYPNLRSLVLKNCEELQGIPFELAAIPGFQILELTTCTSAAISANEIAVAKKNTLREGTTFMLSIYPPIVNYQS